MKIVDIAKKVQNMILNRKKPFFAMEVSEQRRILDAFPEPEDLIERSYFQYLCQMKQLPLIIRFIQNFVSIFWLPFYLLTNYKKKCKNDKPQNNVAIFITGLNDFSYIPESLKKEFNQIVYSGYSSLMIKSDDIDVIKKIFVRYWYKPYFVLKCIMKIGLYSKQICNYNPKAILTFGEFSFTSSILSFYCNHQNIKHINLMHGEKLYDIHDAFVEFDKYYVWDQHYVDLMISLRANSEQFKIEVPRSVELEIDDYSKYEKELTYYLGGETKNDLINLRINLLNTKIPIERICLRYHPRYGDKQQIFSIFSGFQIENPIEVPLSESISKTRYVASLYSTVLYQAFVNGKEIIIDDISNREKYKKLQDLKYIMIDKPHLLLSDLIKGN